VLLVNGEPDEAKELARRFKEFDWVLTTHGAQEPPKEPMKIEGANSYLVEVGQKAEYVVVVGFYKSGSPSFRYQRVPLDHRFVDAPEIYKMQVEYLHQLKALEFQGLGLKQTPHESGRKFVGSKTCAECHTQAAAVFDNTPHAHATETLVKRTDPPRLFDPECLSCHVTGWEPQKYFPFESGYLGMEATPDLVGNGCENCHGPAAKHAAAENGDIEATDAELEELRAQLRLKIVENEGNKEGQVFEQAKVAKMCTQCHDLDNSPAFDFQEYWPKVKHEGKD
jgi:Cytochrome c554 and c-prime